MWRKLPTPTILQTRRTSRATKLEPAGIKRKALQVGQGGGRRGGARRATISRKPRRRVHCASHARNLGLLRRHAHRQLGLGQMTALNREWRHVLPWVSWSTMRLQLNIMCRITKSESWTMSVTKTTLSSFKVWWKPFIFGTPLFKRSF